MRKHTLTTLLFTALTLAIVAQNPQRRDPRTAKNAAELEQIFRQNFETERAIARLRLGNYPERSVLRNGRVMELRGLAPDGSPSFNITDNNLNAAKTLSTDKVWPGGSLGTSLNGQGLTNRLGVWDGGGVLLTHQEFGGRVVQTDGASGTSDHATHVAGTMVAAGVQANAKGMSFQATLKAHDWNSDDAEMATAAQSGMLVSNHSYGTICGWYYNSDLVRWEWYGSTSVSSTEDYKFGLYEQQASDWDNIVYQNPFYLPVKSAGNDRGDIAAGSTWWVRDGNFNWVQGTGTKPPADGQYDCVTTYGCAKNVLTVGAVNAIPGGYANASGVVMSSFSGWGPTDDGRIKPDIVGNGVDVYSCSNTSNTAYATKDGTSMASPNVSGSALLIQQHYNNIKGKFMRASSLKGLIIHTADEAGAAAGPDYTFGWGLMNTAKAVATINDSNASQIIEASLANKATYSLSFSSSGLTPMRVTLCWTDPSGTPMGTVLDPTTSNLINDLDVRLTRLSDNTVFSPYVLNPASPATAATTGDNFRDNIEQIYLGTVQAGNYRITITNKGNLSGGSQFFSLMLTGRTPLPGANFTVSSRTACTGTAVSFTDQSVAATSRMWYFAGGSPATSTALNPSVTYSTPGKYPVALRVTNVAGIDSIYRTEYILVGGISTPLTETFETNSPTFSLWSVANPNNDTLLWKVVTVGGTTPGNKAMGINNFDAVYLNRLDHVISPVFNLIGMQSASLSFQHSYTRQSAPDTDSLIVYISTNCGNNWTRVLNKGEGGTGTLATAPAGTSYASVNRFYPASATDWCGGGTGPACFSVNLTPYLGLSNLKIRFENKAGYGNNMFLDNINITSVPFAPIAGFYLPSAKACTGVSATFMDTSKNAPTNWLWTFDGANITTSTSQNPVVVYSTPGTYKVSLKVTNVTGSDSAIRDNYVTVFANPAAPVVSANNALNLCNGDSVTLTATGAANQQWYKDSVLMGGATAASILVLDSGKYFVRTTDSSGCFAQSAIQKIATGTYPPMPTVTKSITGNSICEGQNFILTSSATAGNQWQKNGTDLSAQTSKTFTSTDSGSFTVKISNANGACNSISSPISISKLTKPNTSAISGLGHAYKNDTAGYSVTSNLTTSVLNWSVTGGAIQSGQGGKSIKVLWGAGTSGSVQVFEMSADTCLGDAKSLSVDLWTSGLNDIGVFKQLKIYPNPVSNYLNIDFELTNKGTSAIRILNMLGQEVYKVLVEEMQGTTHHQIDMSKFAPGVYLLQLEANGASVKNNFIKQ